MAILFTSDLHFGHTKIIGFASRPFSDVQTMDDALVSNWNAKVTPNDQIYILGDFSFSNKNRTDELLRKLNGKKILVAGNHDHGLLKHDSLKTHFIEIFEQRTLKLPLGQGHQKVVVSHYPMRTWDCRHHRSWQLYGHVHSKTHEETEELQMDVGVDANSYAPISLEEIAQIMRTRAGPKGYGY